MALTWSNKKKGWCAGVGIALGLVLITSAIVLPIVINNAVKDEVVLATAISSENQEQWDSIPGPYEIDVIKYTYVYNWTNPDDVILKGAQPEFKEVGPIPYLNTQDFHDVNYTRMQVPWEETQDERVSTNLYRFRTQQCLGTQKETSQLTGSKFPKFTTKLSLV